MILALLTTFVSAELSGTVALSSGKPAASAVVYVEGAKKSAPLADAMVDQRNRQFIPHISVVTTGTTVRFPNNDFVFHNVFADYKAKRFDFGMYPHGATKKIMLDKAGLVALLCSVHSEMSAYVMVVDTPYYAICDRKGQFRIPNIDPGEYKVRVWHESGEISTTSWTAGGNHATLDIRTARK